MGFNVEHGKDFHQYVTGEATGDFEKHFRIQGLRGCLKSLQTGQAAGHNVNHSDVDHGFAGLG